MVHSLPPEVIGLVFENLAGDRATLRNAILVSRTWYNEGITILWQDCPVSGLFAVPEHRRQIYASKVRSLDFHGDRDATYHSDFQFLNFPLIRHLSINSDAQSHLPHWTYLEPRLERFHLAGTQPARLVLEVLEFGCHQLTDILLDNPLVDVTPERLYIFFTRFRRLTHVNLGFKVEPLLQNRLIALMAANDQLRAFISPCHLLTARVMTLILWHEANPWPRLTTLELCIESTAISPLVSSVPSLTELTLHIFGFGSDETLWPTICALRRLRALRIAFRVSVPVVLSQADILALRELEELRSLVIESATEWSLTDWGSVEAPTLDYEVFDELCQHLPYLERLELAVVCDNLSIDALYSLSDYCPHLLKCDLFGAFPLEEWSEHEAPLFPVLETLRLGGGRDNDEWAEEVELEEGEELNARQVLHLFFAPIF